MLKIDINDDVEEYSGGVFLGLSIKEVLHFLLIAVVTVGLVYLLSRFLPIIAAVYISAPVTIAVAIAGRKIGNMPAGELVKFIPTYMKFKKGLGFSSTECPENMIQFTDDLQEEDDEQK